MEKIDYDKLTKEQWRIADKIATAAEQEGIDPDLALAVGWVENRFRSKGKSSAGAVGPMQLRPGAAKDMKVNRFDEDENILGGVRYLKWLSQQEHIGDDPAKILIGYNAGPNSAFFKSGDPNDIPDESVAYVDKINSLTNGLLERGKAQAPADDDIPQVKSRTPVADMPTTDWGGAATWAGLGAAAGAGLGAGRMGLQTVGRVAGNVLQNAATNALASRMPPGGVSPADARIVQGGPGPTEGTTGRARETGFNTRTAQAAAAQKEVEQRLAALQQRGIVGQSARQVFANAPGMTASPTGVLYPASAAPATAPPAPPPQAPGALSRMRSALGPLMNNPITRGAGIGGALAGAGSEFLNRYEAKDAPGMVTTGATALGAGLSAIPGMARVGVPLGALGTAATMGLDAYRGAKQRPPMTPDDFARAESMGVYEPLMKSLIQQEAEFKQR